MTSNHCPPDLSAVFAVVCGWVAGNYPGCHPVGLSVTLTTGGLTLPPVTLPIPPEVILRGIPPQPPDPDLDEAPTDDAPFIPTPVQRAILDALDGRALRTDALAEKVGGNSALFRKPGGIGELIELGRVTNHRRVGYYRPDAPPAVLQSATEESKGEEK